MTDNKELSVNFITREFIMDKNFECATIMHQTVDQKKFKEIIFQRSNIQNVHVQNCTFDECNFTRSNLTNLRIFNSTFINCKFMNADLCFCKLSNCRFENCDFSLAEIENINFYKCHIYDVKFKGSRITENSFWESLFKNVDLMGSTTKFNYFEKSEWIESVFGNCTIDYNVALKCIFRDSKMNLETLGSVWGIQEEELINVSFLSLGREILEEKEKIYSNYCNYLSEKNLCIEMFTFYVSLKKRNIYDAMEQLLSGFNDRYSNEQYLSPDEFRYFYEILKTLRKESMLPLLVIKEILMYFKQLMHKFIDDDRYYEILLLFYNNICLIYNSIINELGSYNFDLLDTQHECEVKITFINKPTQDIEAVFITLYQYVCNTSQTPNIKFIKDATGSYIIWLIMPLAALATFNIGTLLLTGGVKHLIKLRASLAVLFSKKLPRKYYLDVYEKDDSEKLANSILSVLLTKKPSALLSQLRSLSSDGINAKNIKEIDLDDKTPKSS